LWFGPDCKSSFFQSDTSGTRRSKAKQVEQAEAAPLQDGLEIPAEVQRWRKN